MKFCTCGYKSESFNQCQRCGKELTSGLLTHPNASVVKKAVAGVNDYMRACMGKPPIDVAALPGKAVLDDDKFRKIYIDEFVGHTSNPEYEPLKNDKTMEALRDRSVKIDLSKFPWGCQVEKLSQNKTMEALRDRSAKIDCDCDKCVDRQNKIAAAVIADPYTALIAEPDRLEKIEAYKARRAKGQSVEVALRGEDFFKPLERMFDCYIDNIIAYCNKTKIKNPFTGREMEPDERLMRKLEERMDIPEQMADSHRCMIVAEICKATCQPFGHRPQPIKKITWQFNPVLAKAIFEMAWNDCSHPTGVTYEEFLADEKEFKSKVEKIKLDMLLKASK